MTEKERGAILPDVKLPNKKFGKPIELTPFKGRINPDFDQPDFMEKISKFEFLLKLIVFKEHSLFTAYTKMGKPTKPKIPTITKYRKIGDCAFATV